MKKQLVFVELKTGYSDNGPAWIGFAGASKSGATRYFDGRALKRSGGQGISGNYFEAETGDEYWISGVKKNNQDRHWAGGGQILIDEKAVEEYLALRQIPSLPKNIKITNLGSSDFSPEHHQRENDALD